MTLCRVWFLVEGKGMLPSIQLLEMRHGIRTRFDFSFQNKERIIYITSQ